MNPVQEAISRALATGGRDRAKVIDAFDREMEALQFDPHAQGIVLAVPLNFALAWAQGRICDLELALTVNKSIGAVWWFTLPRWSEYEAGLEAARGYYQQGAQAIVCHSKEPTVIRHCERFGCQVITRCDDGGVRLMGGADTMKRWLGRVATPDV